jgi:hypothetical protein
MRHEFVPTEADESVCMFCPYPAEAHYSEVVGVYDEDSAEFSEAFDTSRYASLID